LIFPKTANYLFGMQNL